MRAEASGTVVPGVSSEKPEGGRSSWGRPSLGASRCCAYNRTRERFLSTNVEGADFSGGILGDRLRALTPGCRAGLWISPFRGISATSVSVPIDLIYLDRNFVVLDAVESFPIFQVDDSRAPAASVLAFPADTIGLTETRAGDRLMVCAPEELRARLLESQLPGANREEHQSLVSGQGAAVCTEESPRVESERGSVGEERFPSMAAVPDPDAARGHTETFVSTAQEAAHPAWKKPAAKRNWLERWLWGEPPDPRRAPRESLSWIAAYFFTGGPPKAHAIRDISATGVYLLTEERWYPGTVVRITLSDRRRPSTDRCITLNAKVVRWGNDGVGMQFLLADKKTPRRGTRIADGDLAKEINRAQVEEFLELLRGGNR